MATAATPEAVAPNTAPGLTRTRAILGAAGAAAMGVAPHVLHHVGPLAGAAVVAGATGKVVFGIAGFLLAIPMLRRIRGHTGSWRVPAVVLAVMAAVFAFSAFVVGPALTSSGDDRAATPTTQTAPGIPPGVTRSEHESHH